MALVGDRLWIFDKSDNNHGSSGGWIRDRASLALIGTFRHNISHAATVDYTARTDTMMIGNGGDTGSAAPRIDLFPRFSAYGPGSFLNWNDPAATPRISIPLLVFAADGSVLRSAYPDAARRTANAVWVDDYRTILIFGSSASGIVAVTLTLGMGGEDYSAEGYGRFLQGSGADEYNGTARVTGTFRSALTGTTQGADWHGNRLYLGLTNTEVRDRAIEVLQLSTEGQALVLKSRYFHQPLDTAGNRTRFETEGVAWRGEELLVSAIRADEYQSIYRFATFNTAIDLLP